MKNYYAINAKSISKFNDIYFGIPHNQLFKLHYMCEWMDFYGYWLTREKDHNIPKYYTTFKNGSVVMVNFGPNIGSELSGNHFAIILNKNDKRENKTLTVIPLSSKDHSNYLDLGNELFVSIYNLASSRISSLALEQQEVYTEMMERTKKLSVNQFTYNLENIPSENTVSYIMKDSFNGFAHLMKELGKNLDEYLKPNKVENLNGFINKIIKVRDDQFNEDKDAAYRGRLNLIISNLQDLCNFLIKYETVGKHIENVNELSNKLKKYSKNTYAVIPSVTTVSKLRVVKVSHYTISKNVVISDKSLKKIHESIKSYLDLNG